MHVYATVAAEAEEIRTQKVKLATEVAQEHSSNKPVATYILHLWIRCLQGCSRKNHRTRTANGNWTRDDGGF